MKRKSKKALSLLLSLLLICMAAPIQVFAETESLLGSAAEVEHTHEYGVELSDAAGKSTDGFDEEFSDLPDEPTQDPSGAPEMQQTVPGPVITLEPNEKSEYYSIERSMFSCYGPNVIITDEQYDIESVKISVVALTPVFKDGKSVYKNITTNIDVEIGENRREVTYDLENHLGTITITAINTEGGKTELTLTAAHFPGTINGRSYAPNCAEPARSIKTYVCTYCNERYDRSYTYNEGQAAIGHTFNEEITIDDPCGEDEGQITIKTCEECGFKQVTKDGMPYEFKSDEHDWEEKIQPSGCEDPGTTWFECKTCGAVKDVATIPAIGHAFNKNKWDEEIAADCSTKTNGKLIKHCLEGCGTTSEQTIPWSHKWSSRVTVVEPGCTEPGKSGYKCTVCQQINPEYQQDIAPTGHVCIDNDDCTTPSVCSKCGENMEGQSQHNWSTYYRSGPEGHWHECLNEGCKQISDVVQHIPAKGYDCTTVSYCSVCNYEISPDIAGSHNLVYRSSANYHWQECINPGCKYTTAHEGHTVNTDYNCLTEDKCTICDYVTYGKKEQHNLSYYQSSLEGHFKSCVNPQCNYKTPIEAHSALNDYNCRTTDSCSYCGHVVRTQSLQHNFTDSPYYSSGSEGHYMKCQNGDCEQVSSISAHRGGTATCITRAICQDCNQPYGDFDLTNHEGGTYVEGQINPTLEAEGYTGDIHCLGCDQIITPGTSIPKLEPEHVHSFTKRYNDTESWEQCECGLTQNHKNHSFDNVDALRSDSEGHWHVCDTCEYATEKVSHTPDEEDYDCTTAEYCTECNYEIVPALTHNYGDNYAFDQTGHWHVCTNPNCAVISEIENHNAVDDNNCETPLICEDCGHTLEEAKEHSFSSVWNQGDVNGHYQLCENPGCNVRHMGSHVPALEDGNCQTPIICTICEYTITPAQQHSFANSPYYGDETGHWFVCQNPNCTEHSEIQEHSGGTATCKAKAVCETCGTAYGDFNSENHDGGVEIRNHYDPTTEHDGYSGDVYCLGCDQMITRGHLLDKLPESHTHEFDVFGNDENYHWDECSCGAWDEESRENHVFGSYISNGEGHFRVCAICGYQSAIVPHTPDENDYDCTTSLNCTVCAYEIEAASGGHTFGVKYAYDVNGHWHVCTNPNCNQTANHEEHSGTDDGDCTTQIVCDECGYIMKEVQQHSFTGDWQSDGSKHWLICENEGCNQKDYETEHTGGEANCKHAAVCEVCGTAYGELNPENHSGGTEVRGHRDPTYEETGYTGDTYCLGCNQKIADGEDIPMLEVDHEHSYSEEWKTDSLNHWHECPCGSQSDKGAHNYINGVCTVCKAVDPNYQPVYWSLGDVDHSGKIDATDATLVLQYYAGIIDADTPDFDIALSDVDGNGKIDATDATLILQIYAGIIQSS